jgi:hypothetical protein
MECLESDDPDDDRDYRKLEIVEEGHEEVSRRLTQITRIRKTAW